MGVARTALPLSVRASRPTPAVIATNYKLASNTTCVDSRCIFIERDLTRYSRQSYKTAVHTIVSSLRPGPVPPLRPASGLRPLTAVEMAVPYLQMFALVMGR